MARPFLLSFALSRVALFGLFRPRPTERELDRAQDVRLGDAKAESRARAHEALARHRTRPYGCGVQAAVREAPTEREN